MDCEKCGGRSFWHVRAIRERAHHGLVELGVEAVRIEVEEGDWTDVTFDWRGHYSVLACRRCGFSVWYARELGKTALPVESHTCRECRHPKAHRVLAQERDGRQFDEPTDLRVVRKGFPKFWSDGRFEALLCCGCGRADWFARELTALDPDRLNGLSADQGLCLKCGETRVWRAGPIREMGKHSAQPLALGYEHHRLEERAVGVFSTVICRGCGFCEWFARALDQMKEDRAQGIALVGETGEPVEALRRPPGGPYR
jgi:predicted nucleic-acid-binding Zn-ribbon protein